MLGQLFSNPLFFVVSLLALFVAITVHEFSHAWAADHLGDPTPRFQGRLTLNPMVHIDLYGMLFLLLLGFGWGKPVSFDPYNLQNPKRDAAIISFAGPLSNIILASLLSILLRLIIYFNLNFFGAIGYYIIEIFIQLNVILAVFNLLPIHPLDGFKIVGGFLSDEQARSWYSLERYGFIFLLLLIIPFNGRTSMLDTIIRPAVSLLLNIFIPQMGPAGSGII